MKHSMSFLVVLSLGLSAHAAAAPTVATEETAIRAQLEEWVQAWNAGEASAIAAHYTTDAVRVFAHGTASSGREAVRAVYERSFATPPPAGLERRLAMEVRSVRLLRPDVAVVDYDYRATAIAVFPEGRTTPLIVRKVAGRTTLVMVKQGDRWLRSIQSNWIPMTPQCLRCARE